MLAVACLQFGGDGNKGDEVVGSKSDEGEVKVERVTKVVRRGLVLLSMNVVRVMEVVRRGLGMKVVVIQRMRMLI
ncbi:hypothetical protein Goklo_021069 [Gossypium klotzschianum]|uniref:Uncharacterized protein n=1 Tax=Gossypium klotzschianum TaxID=34286 RepID=A0A7J8UU17_9ROSI|nr:hypothetical protein [Gossypium klotzschianum]